MKWNTGDTDAAIQRCVGVIIDAVKFEFEYVYVYDLFVAEMQAAN
jgi:hypothetical protein